MWVDQAFRGRKYAFAADYIRLYALYNYGGIYLDSDVEVIKPYDELLDLPYFLGQEKTPSGIEAATMGFEKGSPLVKELLDRYDSLNFISDNGTEDITPLPFIIRKYIASRFEYHVINSKDEFVFNDKMVNVFSADFFSPKTYDTGEIKVTQNTYSIHQFAGSWLPDSSPKMAAAVMAKSQAKRSQRLLKLPILQNVNIISNGSITSSLKRRLCCGDINPFRSASLLDCDWNIICLNHEDITREDLSFIDCKKSNFRGGKDGMHPVAVFKNTNIELHFVNDFSRELIIERWIRDVFMMEKKKLVYINQVKNRLSKFDILIVLLKVLLGAKSIVVE